MAEQGSMPAPPTPLAQGGQTPVGGLPSAASNFFSSPALSKGTPIFREPVFVDGTRSVGTQFSEGSVSGDGTHGKSRTEIELGVIRTAELGPTGTFNAQLLWAVRDFIRAQGGMGRPLEAMSVEDIVDYVRVRA